MWQPQAAAAVATAAGWPSQCDQAVQDAAAAAVAAGLPATAVLLLADPMDALWAAGGGSRLAVAVTSSARALPCAETL